MLLMLRFVTLGKMAPMIDPIAWLNTYELHLTAAGNGAWGGIGFFTVVVAQTILSTGRGQLSVGVEESARWARLGGVCVEAHRWFWNLAIAFRDPWPGGGDYSPIMLDWKHITMLYVAGMVYAAYRFVRPHVPPRWAAVFPWAFLAWIVFRAAVGAALV